MGRSGAESGSRGHGAYDERNRCVMGELRGEELLAVGTYRLVVPGLEGDGPKRVIGRGPLLHIFTSEALLQVDVRDVGPRG